MKIILFLSLLALLSVGCASDYANLRDGRGQRYVDPRFRQNYVSEIDGVGAMSLPVVPSFREYHYNNFGNNVGFGFQQGGVLNAQRVNDPRIRTTHVIVEGWVQPPVSYMYVQPYPCYYPQVYMPPMIMPGFGLRNDFPGLSR